MNLPSLVAGSVISTTILFHFWAAESSGWGRWRGPIAVYELPEVKDASFVQQKIGPLIGLQRPFLLIFCGVHVPNGFSKANEY
jgi:hypothetical protein